MASFVTLARHDSKSFLYVFSADPQRLFLLLYILVSVPTLWTQGNCLVWGPSDRTGLAGTEYHQTLNRVVRALQSVPQRQFFKLAEWFSSYHL